jgi:hypothetical protein
MLLLFPAKEECGEPNEVERNPPGDDKIEP